MFKSYRSYKVEEIHAAYNEGRRAFRDGDMPESNPYPKRDDPRGDQWLEGWYYEKWMKQQELREQAEQLDNLKEGF